MKDRLAWDALAEAKKAQQSTANGTKVILPLSVLESLIAELERLRRVDNLHDIAARHGASPKEQT